MPNITIQKTIYPNATSLRLKNKRVTVISTKQKDYQLVFKILTDNFEPRSMHIVKKNVVTTVLNLSQEAAVALVEGLMDELKKEGIYF